MTPSRTPIGLTTHGRLAFLFKDSVLYGGAAALSKAFALVTFPLLARHFTVEEYGVLDYFTFVANFIAIVFIFGQDSAVARYFYEYQEENARQQLITQSLVFQMLCVVLFAPLLWFGAQRITDAIISAPERELLFKLVLLQLPFLVLINFSQNLLKWTFERAKFLTISLGHVAAQAIVLVAAVMIFDISLSGVLLVGVVTSSIFGGLGLFFIRDWLIRPGSLDYLWQMVRFAIPYGIIGVVVAFSPILERSLTESLLGAESLGFYAVATKIAMLIGLVVGAFQTAWGPFSLSLFKEANAGHTYNWVFRLFSFAMCIAALIITLISQPLISILATDRYLGASIIVFPLVMGLAIQGVSWITEIGIDISKRSYLALYGNAAAILVTFGALIFLTPAFGLLGVGLAVLFGQIARALVASWLAQKAYPLPWQYLPVTVLMTATLLGGLSSIWAIQSLGLIYSNLLLGATVILIIVGGWLFLFPMAERESIKQLIRQWPSTN